MEYNNLLAVLCAGLALGLVVMWLMASYWIEHKLSVAAKKLTVPCTQIILHSEAVMQYCHKLEDRVAALERDIARVEARNAQK